MAKVVQWKIVLVLCTFFFFVVARAWSRQCQTNPDGSVRWGTLPSLGSFQSGLDYKSDDSRRDMLSGMARGFVTLVTPPATVSYLIDYTAELVIDITDKSSVIEPWPQFQKFAAIIVGIMVCLSVGIAYLLLVPLVGLFFGYCRCCNNCGGKRVQEPSSCPGCLRVYYTVFLLCLTGVLCAGMAYTNFSNDFIKHAFNQTEPAMSKAISDIQTFSTGTLQQIKFITNDEFDEVDCLIRGSIQNVGEEIADPLVVYLKRDAGVQEAMDAFSNLTSNLNGVYVALERINSSREQVITGTNHLKDSLTAAKGRLDSLGPCTDCPVSTKLAEVAPYETLPDVQTQLDGALDAKILSEGFYTGFDIALNNISTVIDESAQPAVEDVEQILTDTKVTIRNSFQSLSEAVSKFNESLIEVENAIVDWFKTVNPYKDYVYYALIGVTCLTLLIVLFNVIGIAMGTFAYKDVEPTERSRMSNAGGNVLMAGVFFSIIFGPILILICFLLFGSSGTATLTCEPLNTFEIFEKTIDKPGYLGPGYYLGDVLLNDSSVNLTVSSVLTECEGDAALYPTLQLSKLFSLVEFEKALSDAKAEVLTALQNDIEIPTLDFVPNDLDAKLTDAFDAIDLGGINPSAFEFVLSQDVTTTNLTAFAQELRVASSQGGNNATELNNIADELDRIQAEEVEPINRQTALMKTSVDRLAVLNGTLPASISNTATKAQEAEISVNLDATNQEAKNITADYVNQLFDYGDLYVAHVNKQLEEDVANCGAMRNVYDTGVILACNYIFDAVNTLWFTTGWCAIFLLPSIFVAVRLAKYYRIMDEEALPKVKKSKKGSRGRRSNQDMAMEDLPDDGHHTGHDNIRLVETIGQPGMHPQQNPHYIPDDVINGYDGYNNLGRPMAPPPAYNPEDRMRENKRTLFRAMLQGLPERSLERLHSLSLDHDDYSVDGHIGASTSAEVTRPSLSTSLALPPYSRHPSFEDEVYPVSPQHQRRLAAMMMFRGSRSSSHQASREDSNWSRQGSSMEAPYPRLRRQHAFEHDDERRAASLLSPDPFDRATMSQQSSFEEAFPVIIPGPYPLSEQSSPYRQPSDPLFAPPRPSVYCTLSPSMAYPPTNPTHLIISPPHHPPNPQSHHYVNTGYLHQPGPAAASTLSPAAQAPPSLLPAAPPPSILISPGSLRKQNRVVFRQPTVSPPPSPPPPPLPTAQQLPQPDLLPPMVVRPRPLKPLQRQAATVASWPPSFSSSASPSSSQAAPPPPPVPPPRASSSLSTISGHSPAAARRSPVPVPPPRIQIQRQASQNQEQPHVDYRREMPPVAADSYSYGYSQDPMQQQHRDSVVRDMRDYNKKPRATTYL